VRDTPRGPAPPPREAADGALLGNRALALMAVACVASVADGYYIQPLLVEIGASLAVPERLLGLLPALTQAGVAAGVLFLLPLADLVSARRLLLAVIPAQMGVLLSLRRLVQPAAAGARDGPAGYRRLLLSMVRLLRTVPALRAAAACQALSFGSLTCSGLGRASTSRDRTSAGGPNAVGVVAVAGAIAASGAPFLGRAADIAGAHAARTLSFAAMALGWIMLAMFRHSLTGMAAGFVLLDVGATVADITGRTILYRLDPAIRARLNALCTVAVFAGGGILSSLVGPVWAAGGWLFLCGLGLVPVLLAGAIAAADQRGRRGHAARLLDLGTAFPD